MSNYASSGKRKGPHHKGSYDWQARKVREAARANPSTRCWRCGLTLAQVRARYPDRRVHWTAGHVNTGEVNGRLLPECSVDNYRHGAAYGNRLRGAIRRNGGAPAATQRLNTSRPW